MDFVMFHTKLVPHVFLWFVKIKNKNFNQICAKARIALINEDSISLTHLKLNAAVTLARLINAVSREINQEITDVHLWSDSTIIVY